MRTRRLIVAIGAFAAFATPGVALARAPVRSPLDTRPRETAPLERAKQRADRVLPPASRNASPAPRTQLFSGVQFDGLSSTSNAAWAGYTPPDPTGSVGPANYVEIVNSMIAVYDKTGAPQGSPADLQTFFINNGLPLAQGHTHDDAGDSVFDVQVQWDGASDRWLVAAADVAQPADSSHSGLASLVYGFSKTADPTGQWCVYQTTPAAPFEDYPKLGHDGTHLMIGTNEFADSSDASPFLGAQLWTAPTPDATPIADSTPVPDDCPAAPATGHPLTGAFTPVPVNVADATSSTTGYVVATTGGGTQNSIKLYSVDASANVSGPSSIPVSSWSPPPNVQQPGTTSTLDSQDGRLTQAVAVNGDIWTQHSVRSADGKRAEVRWYELDGTAKTKLQQGSITDPSNSVFNPAVSPAMDGTDAGIQYNVGGAFHLVEVRSQTRDAATAADTMVNELRVGGPSAAIDNDFTCAQGPSCRWGDYSGMSPDPDPSNTHTVWGTNQLNGSIQPNNDPSWITRNFAVQFSSADPAPDTTVDGFPFTTPSPTPAFNFASSETGSTFRCSIDGGASAACAPGQPFGGPLGNGAHTFSAQAVDASGQPDPTPAQGTFTVAAALPDTAIDSGPPASGNVRTAAFSFHSSKAGSTFQCSLDGSAFTPCGPPFTTGVLSIGAHAFAVRAVDAQGNTDPTPAASSFKVLLARPRARVRSQRASRRGTVAVRVTCPAVRAQLCAGSVVLTYKLTGSRRTIRLGTKRHFRVSSGHTANVHAKLRRSAVKLLRQKKRLRVIATVTFTAPSTRTTKAFRLSAPRKS
ncbi:MAG TPA: hypothetical protein VF032_18580 [Thermoleophilaceae bacterium]